MLQPQPIPSILVDNRNFDEIFPELRKKIKEAPYCGIDIETHNGGAHDGIKLFNKKKKGAFDIRRTVITGISFYPEGDNYAYYVNLNHLDSAFTQLGEYLFTRRSIHRIFVACAVAGFICVCVLHFFFGIGISIGFVGPRSLSAFARSQIAF